MKTCPRCLKETLPDREILNALSRRGPYYVCPNCGTEEALEDFYRSEKLKAKAKK